MLRWTLETLEILLIITSHVQGTTPEGQCDKFNAKSSTLDLSFERKLNDSDGQWLTTFSAEKVGPGNSTGHMKLEAKHSSVDCEGTRRIHVELVVKEGQSNRSSESTLGAEGAKSKDGLFFHHRHSRNIVLFNGGLSAQRLNLEDNFNCAAFTNRQLKNNEMFQVRVDRRIAFKDYCEGIGVMIHSPDEVKFYESMYNSDGIWMYHSNAVYGNNRQLVANYGLDSCQVKVGDTVGVMRKDTGKLHFYYNGVDQGTAISSVPENLYGVFEVRGLLTAATIVN